MLMILLVTFKLCSQNTTYSQIFSLKRCHMLQQALPDPRSQGHALPERPTIFCFAVCVSAQADKVNNIHVVTIKIIQIGKQL